jgi:chemotaxis protein MotB
MKYFAFLIGSSLFFLSSCVSKKAVDQMKADHDSRINRLEDKLRERDWLISECSESVESRNKTISTLKADTAEKALTLASMHVRLAEANRKVAECEKELEAERKKLGNELSTKNSTLQERELALNQALAEAEEEKARAKRLAESLAGTNERLKMLERELRLKDSAVNALRESVARALIGFRESGLNVVVRNGKVYVSMDEKLLFQTGSTAVDKRGREALLALAEALRRNPDITINVEGHTDDQPIKGGPIRDNWDLSVLRATSIIRILTVDGQLDPVRIYASGRSEYNPIDKAKSAEARAKNRRTEIILTPRLDQIMELIEH